VRGVASGEERLGPDLVVEDLGPAQGGPVLGPVGGGVDAVEVEGDSDLAGAPGAQCTYREAVGDQKVVGGGQRAAALLGAGCVPPLGVADEGGAVRLVEGDPAFHPVPVALGREGRVRREGLGGVPHAPAATILECLREVPVVEGDGRCDAGGQQVVDEAVVEVQALGVDRSGALGQQAGPGDREPVAVDAEPAQQADVLAVAVVVAAGGVARGAAEGAARGMAEGVPDGRAAAVLVVGALDLVGGGGGAPDEVLREDRVG
jgi:hypothetical protein